MRFGISTYLLHDRPLTPAHLVEVARREFLLIELFATRSHFDYHDLSAVRSLANWLTDAGLFLHSVHAPVAEGFANGAWVGPLSTASGDATLRTRTIREIEAALEIAAIVPFEFLVVHVGRAEDRTSGPGDNNLEAARRSVAEIHALAEKRGVRLALEVIPNRLSTVESLARLIDEDLELPDVGICLDYGHAFLAGDLADTIEDASGHLVTTHIHDNLGRTDAHLVPFDGRIDWSTAVMTTQKVGYEGVWLMELAGGSDPEGILRKAHAAARRLEDVG